MEKNSIKKERIAHLKEVKKLARKFLDANIAIQQTRRDKWEREVNKNNISQLKSIIAKANKDLHDQSINEYVEKEISQQNFLVNQNHFLSHPDIYNSIHNVLKGNEIFKVLRFSPNFSIVYDLYWIEDGTVGDQMKLAYGECSPNIYEKYCPNKIEQLTKLVIPDLYKLPSHSTSAKLLNNITKQFNANSYLASNILLITVAESMVRELCRFVYRNQHPDLTSEQVEQYVDKKQSIESLIINDDWLNDLDMDVRDACIQSEYIDDTSLSFARELVEVHKKTEQQVRNYAEQCIEIGRKHGIDEGTVDEQKLDLNEYQNEVKPILLKMKVLSQNLLNSDSKIKTSIKVKLQFLVRRFKEDRNSIIHGNYTDFDKGWKCYIYLAAIKKIWEVIKLYDKLYKKTA